MALNFNNMSKKMEDISYEYLRLKAIYEENKDDPKKIITYDGQDFLIGYLKYFLENLENKYLVLKGK